MSKKLMIFTPFCLLVLPALLHCGNEPSYPTEVAETLSLAGANSVELETLIEHYRQTGDSLKLEAAFFLIANMGEHSYATYRLVDRDSNDVPFDVLDYPDYDSLRVAFKQMEETLGELEFIRDEKVLDVETITADFLIEEIGRAF
jgi:hypothetical protein